MQGAKTADQALIVLLALESQPLSASALAETTGLNRTVVHRMLATLHGRGFARREG
jgi:DNA-binding IclR family transcriptional regulator